MGLFNDLDEFNVVQDDKKYLTMKDLETKSLIGTWQGRSNLFGDIHLGFDSSKGLLYNIKANLVSTEAGYTFNQHFWITKIIPQNTEINLMYYSDVVAQKHFTSNIKINNKKLTILTNGTKLSSYIVMVQCYAFFGYVTDRIGPQGVKGDQGDPGIPKDSDGNYNVENKKIVNLKLPNNDNDAVSKIYLDQIPGVSLTRSIKAASGLFLEGAPLDGLPLNPPTFSSATPKRYVDNQDNIIKAYVNTKDTNMKTYVDDNDRNKFISTINEIKLESRDFSNIDGRLQLFDFGGIRDFTSLYHNIKSHAVITISRSPCDIYVTLRNISAGNHSLRIEAIINHQDPYNLFSMTVSLQNNNKFRNVKSYNERVSNYVIIVNYQFEAINNISQHDIQLSLAHHPSKEIALFIYGRQGWNNIHPLLIDNVNYKPIIEKTVVVPRIRSFESGDRRFIIIMKTNLNSGPRALENLISYDLRYQPGNTYIGDGTRFFQISFPCLVSIKWIILRLDDSLNNTGFWMVSYYNENTGLWVNILQQPIEITGFTTNIRLSNNIGMQYKIIHMSGTLSGNTIIKPLHFELQNTYYTL